MAAAHFGLVSVKCSYGNTFMVGIKIGRLESKTTETMESIPLTSDTFEAYFFTAAS